MAALILSLVSGAWSRLSGLAAIAAAIVAALGVAWLRGRAAGSAAWQKKNEAARYKAIRKSKEIRHDVQNDSDADLDRRLDRWMRD